MARFDVYRNPDGGAWLLDVQADLLRHMNTRVVVPLMALPEAPKPAGTLNPVFEIENAQVAMVTQYLAAIPASLLKQPVCTLEARRVEITAALDLLFQGF